MSLIFKNYEFTEKSYNIVKSTIDDFCDQWDPWTVKPVDEI